MFDQLRALDPASGIVIDEVPVTPVAEVEHVIARARAAQPAWEALGPEGRIARMEALERLLRAIGPEIAALVRRETGKIEAEATYEVDDIADAIPHYARELRRLDSTYREIPRALMPAGTEFDTVGELRLEPHGVVAAIMPWNFPFWIPMSNLIPALLAGNSVILKPSELTPLTGERIGTLFEEAGLPENVLQVIQGDERVGRALVAGDCDAFLFTGGLAAGLEIRAAAGLRPTWIESGGNSGALVCADADLEMAARGTLWGGTYHAGQSCSSHQRVYVHQDVADRFIPRLIELTRALRPREHYGPYIRPDAMYAVHERVRDAVARGATLLSGGAPITDMPEPYTEGFWYPPTLIQHENDRIPAVCDEVFGNLIALRVVASEEEGIERINDNAYGLTGVIWSRDLARGRRLADRLEAGMVFVNDADYYLVGGEFWGGWKASGEPALGGKLEKCLRQKLVITHLGREARGHWFGPGESDT